MKGRVAIGFIFFLITSNVTGQTVDHFETVVYDSMKWRYWVGTSDPGATWNAPAFDDASWPEGRGGIGYGDGDDRTEISSTLSVFLRKKFTITNRDQIADAILHVDYDDGFIAYLNGVEIARAYMNPGIVLFNQGSNGLHEAQLPLGLPPEGFRLTADQLSSLLIQGENTLAIQVHNDNVSSSDLSSSVFFSVGITNGTTSYLPTPGWFVGPLTFSSNLPIIHIQTHGQTIQDETRIVCDMGIIENGEGIRNHMNDPLNHFNGKISIEIRGESSQMFPKKSFRVETQDVLGNNLNVSLLDMPAENDWVLYAPYTDKTMMRDVLAFKIGRDLGAYAPRTRYVELVINGNYEGVYVLMEKIKRDKNRVDIATLQPEDISGLELTGGYLLRVDKIDNNDFPSWTATPIPQLPNEWDIQFQYDDPEGAELRPEQRAYIQSYMKEFQSSLTGTAFADPSSGYKSYLDVPAVIDFLLVNEIGKNVDAYKFSTYLYKEKDKETGRGKLVMGPLWDFNLAFGNVDYWQNSQYAPGWIWNDAQRMFWFRRMLQDPQFFSALKCRWQSLREEVLTYSYFMNTIDSIANLLEESQARNYTRWPILGTYVWPNQFIGQTYPQEIYFLKQWLHDRLVWMDANLSGPCEPVVTEVNDPLTSLDVFPNPFDEGLTVRSSNSNEIKHLQILDSTGKLVFTDSFSAREYQWQGNAKTGAGLPSGLYLIQLTSASGKLIGLHKVIKK